MLFLIAAASAMLIQPASQPADRRVEGFPEPKVTVIATGKEPRTLRLNPTKGTTWHQSWRVHNATKAERDGVERRDPTPQIGTFNATLSFEVIKHFEDGSSTLRWEALDAAPVFTSGATAEMKSDAASKAQAAVGLTGEIRVSDRGVLHTETVSTPEERSDDLAASLVQHWIWLLVPLPEEPVGLGATWTAEWTVVYKSGSTLQRLTTYEIVSLSETKLRVRAKGTSTSDHKTSPSGHKYKSITISESGDLELDFDRPVPRTSDVTTNTLAKFEAENAAKVVDVSVLHTRRIRIAETKPKASGSDSKK